MGIPESDTFHDALNDAVYTAKIFAITHPAEIKAEVFNPLTMLAKKPKKLRTNVKSLLMYVEEKMEKELTESEKELVKMAYMLGRNHTFDATPTVRKKTEK